MTPAIRIAKRGKAHWADTEIRKAAVEMDEGRYVAGPRSEEESAFDNMGLALGMGQGGAAVGLKPTLEEFRGTHDLNELGRHPRVLEAMAKLKGEMENDPLSAQAMEAGWRLHEMNERQAQKQKWPGQERWIGKENEEMRYGEVLTPQVFYQRLTDVIGESRVLLGRYGYKIDKDSKAALVGLYAPNPDWDGIEREKTQHPADKVHELRHEAELKRAEGLRLKKAKQYGQAVIAVRQATEMFKAAAEMEVARGLAAATQVAEQFVRVGAVQWPQATEWTLMNMDQFGVPTTHRHYGWRTALLTMVRHRVITEDEAEESFPAGDGPAAQWYLEQLYLRRHLGYLDKGKENIN